RYLIPRIPFALGGDYSIENLVIWPRVAAMEARGALATQIRGLPLGPKCCSHSINHPRTDTTAGVVAKIILAMPSGRLSSFSSDQGAAGSNIFADAAAEQLSVDQGQSDAAALGRRPGMGEVSALVAANLWRDSTVTGFAGDQRDYSA